MNIFKNRIKFILKRKIRVMEALIISFLITGGISFGVTEERVENLENRVNNLEKLENRGIEYIDVNYRTDEEKYNWKYNNSQAIGRNAIVIGMNSEATVEDSIAIGNRSRAGNEIEIDEHGDMIVPKGFFGNVAIGAYSLADGRETVAVGSEAMATGEYSSAYGTYARSEGESSYAVGKDTIAIGSSSLSKREAGESEYDALLNKNIELEEISSYDKVSYDKAKEEYKNLRENGSEKTKIRNEKREEAKILRIEINKLYNEMNKITFDDPTRESLERNIEEKNKERVKLQNEIEELQVERISLRDEMSQKNERI